MRTTNSSNTLQRRKALVNPAVKAKAKPVVKNKALKQVAAQAPELSNVEKMRQAALRTAPRASSLEVKENGAARQLVLGNEPVTGLPMITVTQALQLTKETPDLPLYVVNISDRVVRKGYSGGSKTILAINAEGYNPNKQACVRVIATSIPQDVTIYDTTREKILRSSDFRQAVQKGYLVIVDTEAAEQYLNTDESAQAEIERLQNANAPASVVADEKDERAAEVSSRVSAIMADLIPAQKKKAQLSALVEQMSSEDFLHVLRVSSDAVITTWANEHIKNSN